MRRSFTISKEKYILSPVTKVWLLYFCLSGIFGAIFVFRIIFQTSELNREQIMMQNQQAFLIGEIAKVNANIARTNFEIHAVKNVQLENILMRDSLQNLLNIVPAQITLHSLDMRDGELVIKGVTPSKEIFIFLLQDPLKAIFGESDVGFFELNNGVYEFTSKSKMSAFFTEKSGEILGSGVKK